MSRRDEDSRKKGHHYDGKIIERIHPYPSQMERERDHVRGSERLKRNNMRGKLRETEKERLKG